MSIPAWLPAVAVVAGTTAGIFIVRIPLPAAPLAIGVGWTLACAAYRRGSREGFLCGSLVAFALVAWTGASAAAERALMSSLGRVVEAVAEVRGAGRFVRLEGRLRRDAGPRPWGAILDVAVDRVSMGGTAWPVAGGVRLNVGGAVEPEIWTGWRAGRRIRVPVDLRPPTSFRNPGVPDAEQRQALRGTVWTGSVKSPVLVEGLNRGSWAQETASGLRQTVRRAVDRTVGRWSRPSAAVVTAILIGDRSQLDEAVQDRLRRAGTYHVMAISGGNIAIFVALLLGILRGVGCPRRVATLLTLAGVGVYVWIVGEQPSVTRAAWMAAVYLTARVLDHRGHPLNALAVAVTVTLMLAPLSLADAGFALTVGATLAILLGAAGVQAWLPSHPWLRGVGTVFAASLCAEVAVFPITAMAFSQVTIAGLGLNFLAVPLMTVCQVAGLAAVALDGLRAVTGPLPAAAGWVAHAASTGLVETARLVDWLPWLAWRVPPPPAILVVAYYLALAGAVTGGRGPASRRGVGRVRPAWVAVTAILALGIVVAPSWPRRAPEGLAVSFLDVGQGDATLVQFPGGRTMLVDAGGGRGPFDVGRDVVVPALWEAGVRRLDVLVVTHGDPDHAGGVPGVLREIPVGEVWEGVPVARSALRAEVRTAADQHGARWRRVQAGDRIAIGQVAVTAWHPPPPDWERPAVRNDDSLVLELRFGDVSIVLPGDVSATVERDLAPWVTPVRVRILKAAHHGSRTSTSEAWLDALRPRVVVFSAGRFNAYGHPSPDVLARVHRHGADVLRTDRQGALRLETNGRDVEIRDYRGRTVWAVTSAAAP